MDNSLLEESGKKYLAEGEYDKAISEFTKIMESGEGDWGISYFRGVAYFLKGKYQLANDDFYSAFDSDFGCRHICYSGLANIKLGEYIKALSSFNCTLTGQCDLDVFSDLEKETLISMAYYGRGLAYTNLNQFDLACPDFEELFKRNFIASHDKANISYTYDPDLATVNYYIASIGKGDSNKIVKQCSDIIEKDPKSAIAYWGRGLAFINLGRRELAIKDFKQILGVSTSSSLLNRTIHELNNPEEPKS
jgi:tetratricopeptide (TPR) repeat protein